MRQCKVSANSKRGKQLITEHGDTWTISDDGWWPMPCFNNSLGIQMTSLDREHTRNVKMIDDQNFTVYYIMEQL